MERIEFADGIYQLQVDRKDSVEDVVEGLRGMLRGHEVVELEGAKFRLYRRELTEEETQRVMDALGRVFGRYGVEPVTKRKMIRGDAVLEMVEVWTADGCVRLWQELGETCTR